MKTVRTSKIDKLDLRLVENNGNYTGLIFDQQKASKANIVGNDPEEVWAKLQLAAIEANPQYVGFDGAISRFLRFFPDGFSPDSRYDKKERAYKIAAKEMLDKTVSLADAEVGQGYGESILAVFRATNLLHPVEKARVQEVLRGKDSDSFIRSVAKFTNGEKNQLQTVARILEFYDCAKWTVCSYLPFLWKPESHMFLKPEVTKDFAARVGHGFFVDYKPELDISVYESLLDLTEKTTASLSNLKPRDRIDVQSFIWVVGDYKLDTDLPS